MLCLDNSSTMALVQLELLHQIEKATGKKITELFQWIVASGIGGLLMLVMIYGMLHGQNDHCQIFTKYLAPLIPILYQIMENSWRTLCKWE